MSELGHIDETMLFFGGPYSNLAATAAMRERARDLGIPPQRTVCTGDVIAYCGEPCETLDLIRDWGINLIMGNCEEALAFGEDDCGCGFEPDSECSVLAVTWYDYANRRVSAEQRRWMRELPRAIDFSMGEARFRGVHASLNSLNEFVFASSAVEDRLRQVREAGFDAIVGGHSGIPFGQSLEERYWLNAGVIGMPANDGGTHGWYMLLEPQGHGVEASWQRLEYDFEASRSTTIAAGMSAYGQALANGLWPNVDILPEREVRQSGRPIDLQPLRVTTAAQALRVSGDQTLV